MILRNVFALQCVINVFASAMCMMPMVFAEDMPMDHKEHSTMQMTMTPAVPMSSLHCEGCVNVSEPKHSPIQQTGCNGHCISQASAVQTALQISKSEIPASALDASAVYDNVRIALLQAYAKPTKKPPQTLKPEMIVLRL